MPSDEMIFLTTRWPHTAVRVLNRLPDGTMSMPYRKFSLRPIGPIIGAEIVGVDLCTSLASETFVEIDRALLEWKVLFFRNQAAGSGHQRAFALNWGQLEDHSVVPHGQTRDAASMVKDDKIPSCQSIWHSDGSWRAEPPCAFMLRMINTPPSGGGDMLWADCAAAYENLSPGMKDAIKDLNGLHDSAQMDGNSSEPTDPTVRRSKVPSTVHPVVRVHPRTGRKMLYVNAGTKSSWLGLEPAKTEWLLRTLFEQACVPEYQVRWQWQAGDVAFWDNWATWHHMTSDYDLKDRLSECVAIIRR